MGYKKYCCKCENVIPPKTDSYGIKTPKARRWQYICGPCRKEAGSLEAADQILLQAHRDAGVKDVPERVI